MGLRHPVYAVVLCALVAVLVYIPTLKYQLVWDDLGIVVQNQSSPLQSFARSFWYGGGAGVLGDDPYYRPLVNFSLGVDELIAGHRAWYFHMVNVLLHAVLVCLACVVVWQLFGSVQAVLVAGMVGAVHPFAADSVAYVSGRTDLLAGAGLLVALLGLLRLQKRHDWAAVAMIWAGFAVGVLSKETAVMFAVVAGVWVLGPGLRRARRTDWIALAGVCFLFVAYVAARYAVLGNAVGTGVGSSGGAWLVLSLDNFGRLLLRSVWPWGQGVFVWSTAGSGRLSWFVVVSFLYMALPLVLRRMRQSREALLFWFWGLVMLLPFAGFAGFGPVGRLLYVPGIGFVLLALYAGREGTRGHRGARSGAVVITLAYCALLALIALPQRMRVWQDGNTLFSRMIQEAPLYPAGHFNRAHDLRRRADVDGAIAEYRRAIELDPSMALAYSNLGALLQSRGELAEAESLYLRTIGLRPNYALAWNNLAIVRYKRGDGAGAVHAFRRAIQLKPDDAGAVYNLGRVYQQAGIADSAASMFRRAYRLDPGNPQIRASYEQTHGQGP
ncbi:tetratricopeptide repeat protein [candidate division WOR-3 bacterium]|uniref:Tetratricopeptide repeat protein n=1 Tax=candidate division WOR-3 bacterium TaxID=2052148 RepID=A0A937XEN8_UNCW3|nr:tetratricopeptide repeat protein [candidate division WOR-3 bacterium]